MNKFSIAIAILILLPLLLGAAGMVTIIAAKFSQTTIETQSSPNTTTASPDAAVSPSPAADPTCGDGICSKNERTNSSCLIDC